MCDDLVTICHVCFTLSLAFLLCAMSVLTGSDVAIRLVDFCSTISCCLSNHTFEGVNVPNLAQVVNL